MAATLKSDKCRRVSLNLETLSDAQKSYEFRFNCPICWEPKLRMVTGLCQHRFCDSCLYKDEKLNFNNCPICQVSGTFPPIRPDIPDDIIEIQRILGVRECTQVDCSAQVWEWDMEAHIEECHSEGKMGTSDEQESRKSTTRPRRSQRQYNRRIQPYREARYSVK